MVKTKKDLQASSAIWRSAIEEHEDESFEVNLFATPNDSNFNMNLHVDDNKKKKNFLGDEHEDSSMTRIDSQLSYTFRRNYQVSNKSLFIFIEYLAANLNYFGFYAYDIKRT